MARPGEGAPRKVHRKKLGSLARIGISLTAVALGILACEIVVRVSGIAPPPMPETRGRILENIADPVLLFENKPGAVQKLLYREEHGGQPRVVELAINNQGFRGPLVAPTKQAGVARIACVGDSHTFGHGVTEEQTWPAHLQVLLNKRLSPGAAEVMNCGVDNYDTMQEFIWMRDKVLAFEPDIVVMQYFLNDIAARDLPRQERPKRDRIMEWSHPDRGGVIASLREVSRFADLVFDGIYRRRGLKTYGTRYEELYTSSNPGWMRVQEALRSTRDELESRGIAFGLALYPFLVREGDTLTSHACFLVLKAFCEAEGIAYLDAEQHFLDVVDVDALRVSPHDFHGNGEANRLFATAVADWLVANGLVGE